MNLPLVRFALSVALAFPVGLAAQIPAQSPTQQPQSGAAQAPSATVSPLPSQIVKPALGSLVGTLDSVRVDKWKGSSANRDRTQANVESVRKDLDSNLPTLLQTADRTPGSLTALLPAARNLDALYDVVLRIAETAHTTAPSRESRDLDAALANLEQARRDFNGRILSAAQADQSEIRSLRQQLAARAAVPPPAEPKPCPKPVTKKRRHTSKKTTDGQD